MGVAFLHGHFEASRYLLDLGADPDLTTSDGQIRPSTWPKSDEMKVPSCSKRPKPSGPKTPSATPPPRPRTETPTTTTRQKTPPARHLKPRGPRFSLVKTQPRNPSNTCGAAWNQKAVGENRFPICPTCKVAKYCGRECQKADWKKDKKVAGR